MLAPKFVRRTTVDSKQAFQSANVMTTHLTVGGYSDATITQFNVKRFLFLKELVVRYQSFQSTYKVEIAGMKYLETVSIGEHSFGATESTCYKRNGQFVLKDCPLLKSFSSSYYTFKSYESCVIENLPMLESLRLEGRGGSSSTYCPSFVYSSLELKSVVLEVLS